MDKITQGELISSLLPEPTETEREQLQDFFYLYKSFYEEFCDFAKKNLGDLPPFKQASVNCVDCVEWSEEECPVWAVDLVGRAILEGKWRPYIKHLIFRGCIYAGQGLEVHYWYDVAKIIRDFYRPKLIANDVQREDVVISALNGMEHFIQISMTAIEEAYLYERETIAETEKKNRDRLNKDAQLLVYNVSHDLKQPLTTVKGLVTLLKEQNPQLLQGESGSYLEHIYGWSSLSPGCWIIPGLVKQDKRKR